MTRTVPCARSSWKLVVLTPEQYDLREGRSSNPLISLVGLVESKKAAGSQGIEIAALFLNMEKAFDADVTANFAGDHKVRFAIWLQLDTYIESAVSWNVTSTPQSTPRRSVPSIGSCTASCMSASLDYLGPIT